MLNKYNTFMVVYKARNFSKAAIELCTTQPAISYAIKELEMQLNISLFHRVHKGVIPTEEGKELYKYGFMSSFRTQIFTHFLIYRT